MRASITAPIAAAVAVPLLVLSVAWAADSVSDGSAGTPGLRPAPTHSGSGAGTERPSPPPGSYWLGDMEWVSATSSWGPVERNTSSGENAAGDGNPITLNGTAYEHGLGVVPQSKVTYSLQGRCSALHVVVGVDDEVDRRGNGGSIVFKVVADGSTVYDSGVRWGAQWSDSVLPVDTKPLAVDLDISDVDRLELVADPWYDGFSNDHGDWADARVTCSQAP